MNHPEQSASENMALPEAQDINQFLLESPAIIYVLDPDPPYIPRYVSENCLRMIGYTSQECLETPLFWYHHLHPEDRELAEANLKDLFANGHLLHHYRFQSKDGTWLWIEDRIRVVRDAQNRPLKLVGSWLDITDRMGAQLETGNILKSSQSGFWVANMQHQILEVNEAYCNMSGYTREEVLKMTVGELDTTQREEDIREHTSRLMQKGVDAFESVHRRKDGSFFDVFVHIYCNFSQKWGSTVAYVFMTDISERKDIERRLSESEQRYRTLVNSSHDAVMTLGPPTWDFLSCNPATLKLFGVKTESKFCSLKPWDLSPEKQPDGESSLSKAKKMIHITLEKGVNFFEWTHRRYDGETFPATVLLSRIEMNDQVFLQATVRDISAEKMAEKVLKDRNKRLDDLVRDRTFKLNQSQVRTRQIIQNALDAIVSMDSDGIITEWNTQAVKTFGWKEEEVLHKNFFQTVFAPSLAHIYRMSLQSYLKTGHSNTIGCRLETRGIKKNGDSFPMELSVIEVSSDGDRRFSAFLRDISFRQVAVQNLKDANKRTEALLRMSNRLSIALSTREAGLAILETARIILPWDSSWVCLYHRPSKTWESVCMFDRIDGSIQEIPKKDSGCCTISPRLKRRIEKGSILILREEDHLEDEDFQVIESNRRSLSLLFAPILSETKLIGIISLQSYQAKVFSHEDRILLMHIANQCAGAMARIQSVNHLASTQKRLANVWENSMDGMRLTDASGKMLHVNRAFASMLDMSMEDLIGKPFHSIYHTSQTNDFIKQYQERFKEGVAAKREPTKVRLWNNQLRTFELSISFFLDQPDQLLQLTIFHDITEREEFQRFKRQAQRLESLGLLAGGIAHDLNNALAPISMSIEMLKVRHPESAKMLGIIESSSRRGSDMVRRLTTFSKGEEGQRENLSSADLIDEISKLIGTTFPKNIKLHIRNHDHRSQIFGDRTQLHQVLLNLCVNARDAMPQGGELSIEATLVDLEKPPPICQSEFQAGRFVVWCVSDTGCGISEQAMEQIFDPYFTTKGPEKGTGLGLSILLGIVTSHHGGIGVQSELGQGSSFFIFLPVTRVEQRPEPISETFDTQRSFEGMTILLVDDEKSVLMVMEEILEAMHITVLTASDGEEALKCLARHQDDIQLVITDVHMPGMNGVELTRRIRKRMPKLPIMVASGLLNPKTAREFRELGVNSFLHKPFTESDLKKALEF